VWFIFFAIFEVESEMRTKEGVLVIISSTCNCVFGRLLGVSISDVRDCFIKGNVHVSSICDWTCAWVYKIPQKIIDILD